MLEALSRDIINGASDKGKLRAYTRWKELVDLLRSRQLPSGALEASDCPEGLPTGFKLNDGECVRYFDRPHVGATAWLVLAERGVNPFRRLTTVKR